MEVNINLTFKTVLTILFLYDLLLLGVSLASIQDYVQNNQIGTVYAMKIMILVGECVVVVTMFGSMLMKSDKKNKEQMPGRAYLYASFMLTTILVVMTWVFDSRYPGSSVPVSNMSNYPEQQRYFLWKFLSMLIITFKAILSVLFISFFSKPLYNIYMKLSDIEITSDKEISYNLS